MERCEHDHAQGAQLRSDWQAAGTLTRELNDKLAPAERIVSAEYIDGYYVVITESFGLGPRNAAPFT